MGEFVKKTIVILLTLTLLLLTIFPIINAQPSLKTTKGIEEKDNSTYDLLIITPTYFKPVLNFLKKHKENNGIQTKIATLNEVYRETCMGRDKPEKIKYYIKNIHEEFGIKYVLLVGNYRKMPIRYVYNSEPGGYPEPYFISELYYADLYDNEMNFSSWDSNENGVFGEWIGEEAQDKNIDLYPDVYVGRLACRNLLEIIIMVKKIITYETHAYNQDWFDKIVVCAGDTYPDGKSGYSFPTPEYEGEENAKTVLSFMPGFENISLFTSDESFTGPQDIIDAVNSGCGFLYFEGHANPSSWSTHKPNSTEWVNGLKLSNMGELDNKNMLPVCVVGGCHNNQFNVGRINIIKGILEDGFKYFSLNPMGRFWLGEQVPECWGWKLTRLIGGGSIATIGCSGLGMTKEDKESMSGAGDFLEPQFFYEYGINGTEVLGECWGNAITNYLNEYPINWDTPAGWDFAIDAKTVQQWVLLGDPSLKIGGYPN